MINFHKYLIVESASIREALILLNNLSSDVLTLFVIDADGVLKGTLTDGDIRRKLIQGCSLDEIVSKAMNPNFQYVIEKNVDVLEIKRMRELGLTLLPCLDLNKRIIKVYNLKTKNSILPIDAVLMGGGKGERLRPLTEKTPKPLIKVGDKAIIDYNIERLISFGVENISVTVNYLKEQIEEHFATEIKGVKVNCVREPRFLGTIGSVKYVTNFENDTVLVMNSDLFTNIDYEDFFLHFKNNNADISIAAVPYTVNIPYGVFELAGRDVLGIKEKPTYNYYANAGIYLVKRELLHLLENDSYFNATDFVEQAISNEYTVIRFPITGYWIDIGRPSDLQRAAELVKHL